ncbi:MAG TPA: HAD hydrolase family protein [Gammaproteobacteria bacterium]|nr:HAD hydrolase family protein [Gammaproteobacteria bacterium]
MGPLPADEVDARAAGIRLLVLDVDGVLTDGGIVMDDAGNEFKRFHVRDGHGIKLAQRHGIAVGLITGRRSGVVAERAAELGIAHVYQGAEDKRAALADLLARLDLAPAAMAMVGDDVVDLPLLVQAGLAVTVADGHPAVRERAHWVTAHGGGAGAVREVCDRVLRAQGHEAALLQDYLEPG